MAKTVSTTAWFTSGRRNAVQQRCLQLVCNAWTSSADPNALFLYAKLYKALASKQAVSVQTTCLWHEGMDQSPGSLPMPVFSYRTFCSMTPPDACQAFLMFWPCWEGLRTSLFSGPVVHWLWLKFGFWFPWCVFFVKPTFWYLKPGLTLPHKGHSCSCLPIALWYCACFQMYTFLSKWVSNTILLPHSLEHAFLFVSLNIRNHFPMKSTYEFFTFFFLFSFLVFHLVEHLHA